jgi:hypothetical protein
MTARSRNKATKAVASTLGVLVGLAGIEHGFFEYLQGKNAPDNIMINAIGPAQRFWTYGTERALTIIPSFTATGLLAIAFGLLVLTWALVYLDRRHGAVVLMLLSTALWLVGGGFAPIFISILASVTATRIYNPLDWWRRHLSQKVRDSLVKLWPWSLGGFVLLFIVSVEIAIFGYPLLWFLSGEVCYGVQTVVALFSFGLMPVALVAAFAFDLSG